MMSRIECRHWKISTGRHFQNGHHNTAQIQHCPISKTFRMGVDYAVPNWFLTSKNFYRSPFWKWPPQYRTNSTLFDFNVRNWFPTSNVAILKMATGGIFQCRDIIIYPHIKFWWYRTMLNFCGIVAAILKMATGRNWFPTSNNFLPVSIFKMAATIPQKFNIVRFQR
jgi:hypothetical protein